ncbi:MAG: PilZ domain-containing protein [Terriglobia bacterium]
MPESKDRRSTRKPVALALLIVVEPESEESAEAAALAKDLSEHGLQISTRTDLKTGQLVDIRANEGLGGPVRARVVWVGAPESDKQYRAGLEFLSPLKVAT